MTNKEKIDFIYENCDFSNIGCSCKSHVSVSMYKAFRDFCFIYCKNCGLSNIYKIDNLINYIKGDEVEEEKPKDSDSVSLRLDALMKSIK